MSVCIINMISIVDSVLVNLLEVFRGTGVPCNFKRSNKLLYFIGTYFFIFCRNLGAL